MLYKKRMLAFITLLATAATLRAQIRTMHAAEIKAALQKVNTVGSVLYIAAHPDDENTNLLAYFSKERLLRTGYLSLTRGDGGQNLIGTEQGEELGLIRTQELVEARKIDGAEQFFTRALDFGFSKNPEETYTHWDKEKLLSDVVWCIRQFKPDVIINRFPTTGEGGHGHHTVSALLSVEAFSAAANPKRFPEQLKYVSVWQTKRLFMNVSPWFAAKFKGANLKVDVGKYNPLLGKSYNELASQSRSQHKSQGFGVATARGKSDEELKYLAGDSAYADPLNGVDLTWKRVQNSDSVAYYLEKALQQYDMEKPNGVVPVLLQAYKAMDKLKDGHWKTVKQKELQEILLHCLGIYPELLSSQPVHAQGSVAKLTLQIVKRTAEEVILQRVKLANFDTTFSSSLPSNEWYKLSKEFAIDKNTPLTQPYWLREKAVQGLFDVKNQQEIGLAQNQSVWKAELTFNVHGQEFTYAVPALYKWSDRVEGELFRNPEIVPPLTASLSFDSYVFADSSSREVAVSLVSNIADAGGSVRISVPKGWKAVPEVIDFSGRSKGEEWTETFHLHPSTTPSLGKLKIAISAQSGVYTKSIRRISHPHIWTQTYFPETEATVARLNATARYRKVGYIMGSGDEIPACLRHIGYSVTLLDDDYLKNKPLKEFDAIVIGIRAYNTLPKLATYQSKLNEYVEEGGRVIVQYNTQIEQVTQLKQKLGPYPFKISRERVTVEEAPVSFVKPDHVLLNKPNKISKDDFAGWVQERCLYTATDWDTNYETVLACQDPGEKSLEGGLLYARYGKGAYIYTTYSWWRQLPAGVPGAYRFFINMVEGE